MPYSTTSTALPEVMVLQPKVFDDSRGFFYESFNAAEFERATKLNVCFVQDNHSKSARGVLRGLHYQINHPQGKLVRVIGGEVQDVAVDIRKSSSNYGKWISINLSAGNRKQLWIPPGFAHGFLVLSDVAEFLYKTTDYWHPEHERSISWNDADLAINWQLDGIVPQISEKDAMSEPLKNAESFP